ncbi:MAG: SGNH/GDSL hydrolase family protein [Verrucomicrobiota bacterium]
MISTDTDTNKPALDRKPYIRHHPTIGYEYVPNTELTLPAPGGGNYTIRINSDGIRSNRRYEEAKPSGTFRILVFGDSFAAGQYVNNEKRFSELLERRIPNLEVINFGLEGTGTDQQLLIYEEIRNTYEHDLVILLPFLQNIRRNMVESREGFDPESSAPILIPKPRFKLINNELRLQNVPVPKERKKKTSRKFIANTDTSRNRLGGFKNRLSNLSETLRIKRLVYTLMGGWEPFPEYRSADTEAWLLMSAILTRFADATNGKPLVIVPVFYNSYVSYRMATNYLDRFQSLDDGTQVRVIDMLPDFKKLGEDSRYCFQVPHDCHFSVQGHLTISQILENHLSELALLPDS